MDALRAELERRRAETNRLKQKAGVAVAAKGRKRFVRRGDLERARRQEAEEAIAKANAEDMRRRYKVAGAVDEKGRPVLSVQPGDGESRRSKKRRRGGDGEGDSTLPPSSPAASPSVAAGVPDSPASPAMALSREAAILRLRVIGQPITLFGESDKDRFARLRVAEAKRAETAADEDMRLGAGHDISNVFLAQEQRKHRRPELDMLRGDGADASARSRKKAKKSKSKSETEAARREKAKKDPGLYCRWFFKRMLREWEEELMNRPEHEARTALGRQALNTHKQCKDYMRPFFRMCKRKEVPPNILKRVRKIVKHCEDREYVKANDEYLLVAVGNAPWPMGVTSIGIHERAARTKIFADKVAHVMNDEAQRKYITSIKRLMTFAQRRYPTDPSKMVVA